MKIIFVAGRLRRICVWLWIGYMAWVAWYWLGLAGVGLVCVASTRMLRGLWVAREQVVAFDVAGLTQVWIMPWAVCIYAAHRQRCYRKQWLCRDEVPAAQWAALLRGLGLHVPRQAVGLSMSN